MIFGSGEHSYRAVEGWGLGPDGWSFGIVSSMATDSQDRVYIIDREPKPAVVVLDRDGRLLNSWGDDFFEVPHSIWISPDDVIYMTDSEKHTVSLHTLDGELISILGTPGKSGELGVPFNSPTWVVLGNHDDLYVTDGYGQNYVHRFSTSGELLQTWGGSGNAPGQFDIPHCVRVDRNDRVLVIDRSNARVQIFDPEGAFQEEWTHLTPANDLFIDADDVVYLAEAPRRISILDLDGKVITQWGEEGAEPGQMVDHPHGIWVDSHGDIYMCEVPFTANRLTKYERA
jgi:sugar lactone lactonase YvrE